MKPTVLFTGFPGFLGSGLLPRVLVRAPGVEAVCLVQPPFAELARRRANDMAVGDPRLQGRIRLVEGDITRPDLGLAAGRDALLTSTREVYHLAALYDLAAGQEPARRVNVDGTRHVLAFASSCRALVRLHYASTCYVSGRYAGRFTEAQLEESQAFNNFYEETKHAAEVLVRNAMAGGLPATIYRPAIVVGDSRTGATEKYDGPYHTVRWLLRQPRVTVIPLPAAAGTTQLNLVPCDFVLDAIAALGAGDHAIGRTFHLADPSPLTVRRVIEVIARETGRRVLPVPVPSALARAALRVPAVSRRAPIPASMLDYTALRARYDTTETTRALEGTGIACPRFTDYAARLVAFVRAHPDVRVAAMA